MTQEQRQKLIEEKDALEANLSSPSDLRRVGEIKSLLLTDGQTDKILVMHESQKCAHFSKRSMSGFTNRRRR